jgi:hypothetical protein
MDLFSGEAKAEIYLVEGLTVCADAACDPGAILSFLSYFLCVVRNRQKNDTNI